MREKGTRWCKEGLENLRGAKNFIVLSIMIFLEDEFVMV